MSEPTVLEPPTRLSKSVMWDLQRRFFETSGQSAWVDGVVPYFVTTNAYTARSYARLIAAWVEDLLASADHGIDPDQPIHVVELGAGTGRLSFLLAHELDVLSKDRGLPRFRVVATDFADANVQAWRAHPDLAEAWADGRLDGARFDADHPGPLALMGSGETLGPEPVVNPIIAVLNYVVDSLRQDAFAVRDGVLQEIRVQAVMPPDATRDVDAPDATADVQMRRSRVAAALPFYDDDRLDALLQRYCDTLHHAEVLIPIGAIRAVRALRELSGDRLLAITGDKGFRQPTDLDGVRLGELVKCGCFSFMANLDAIAFDMGGVSLSHDNRYTRFTVSAHSSVNGPMTRFRGAYRDLINDFGPAEYNRLFKLARSDWRRADVPLILLLLRLSGYDPTAFARWSSTLMDRAADLGAAMQHDLVHCLEQVLLRTYKVSRTDDVRFVAGRLLFRLERFAQAEVQFSRCTVDTPDRRAAWFNLGLSRERLGHNAGAAPCFEKALALDPDYDRARAALQRVS